MSAERRGHPLFARTFDRLCAFMEAELARHREELLRGVEGHVIELGAGNGANFRHYQAGMATVVAVEPEPYLRGRAELAAARASAPISVIDAVAESLPHPAGSFDVAVCSLVLCSVPDQQTALAELRRVLRPGGELRYLEHIRSPVSTSTKARVQVAIDRSKLWPAIAGGCHCARQTEQAISAAGFQIEQQRYLQAGPAWLHTNPHVLGRARLIE